MLNGHEPRYLDVNSTLHKEMWEASQQARAACPPALVTEMLKCIFSATRPVWQRNAPGTIKYYDEYTKKELEFARRFEASGAGKTRLRAVEYYKAGMKQALADWNANAQRDIQAANAQNAAARQQASQTFSDILGAVADIALAVAEIKTGQPLHQFRVGQ